MRCGIIDLGSNTIRLVVYEIEGGQFSQLINEKEFLGIINYIENDNLTTEGLDKIVSILGDMRRLCALLKCEEFYCFATASLRHIENLDVVLTGIREQAGVDVAVISGREEAYYDYLGLMACKELKNAVGCDVGGGSGQVFTVQDGGFQDSISLPIGCLRMYNAFVKGLLPRDSEMQALYDHVRKMLKEYKFIKQSDSDTLYVMGGTARAMAKLHRSMTGVKQEISGYRMDTDDITTMIHTVKSMNMEGVKLLNKVLPERSHTIVPGMLVLGAIAKTARTKRIEVVKNGVREGFVVNIIMKRRKRG